MFEISKRLIGHHWQSYKSVYYDDNEEENSIADVESVTCIRAPNLTDFAVEDD